MVHQMYKNYQRILFLFFVLGGFYGCDHAVTDVRCRQSARKYYSGEAFDSSASTNFIGNLYLFLLFTGGIINLT